MQTWKWLATDKPCLAILEISQVLMLHCAAQWRRKQILIGQAKSLERYA